MPVGWDDYGDRFTGWDRIRSERRATDEDLPKRYWRNGQGKLMCRHGIILYGTSCVQCEREKEETKCPTSK